MPRCRPPCVKPSIYSSSRRRHLMSARGTWTCWALARTFRRRRTRAPSRRCGHRRSGRCYDNAQALARRLFTAWQHPQDWLNIPQGGVALDVGCGPGNVTAMLADAVGPDGLALGVDISEPMLARAVRSNSRPQLGFMRADAQRLPLRDDTVDAIVSIAVLQLVPDPSAAVA